MGRKPVKPLHSTEPGMQEDWLDAPEAWSTGFDFSTGTDLSAFAGPAPHAGAPSDPSTGLVSPAEIKRLAMEALATSAPASIVEVTTSSGGADGDLTANLAIGSTYDIVIVFSGDATYQAAFTDAALRWEAIVTGEIPDVNNSPYGFIDDLLIHASIVSIDGPGNVLGQAGPDAFRSGSLLPSHGVMEFDSADVAGMFANGTWTDVILHEMGHILGIGTLWDNLNLINGAGDYIGAHALAEYRTLAGNPTASSIAVEHDGGPGTAGGHWDEETFNHELMTGFIESASVDMPISRMTVGSLEDMGYTVNYAAADPYTPPPPPSTPADDYADSLSDSSLPFGQVAVNNTRAGRIEVVGDRDWFAVQLVGGTGYTINLEGAQTSAGTLDDPYLRLYDSSGALLAEHDDLVPGLSRNARIAYTPSAGGTYYVSAGAYDDETTGTYRVGVTASSAPEITVLGNGVSIADGDTSPSTGDHTNFGSVNQGGAGTTVTRTFTVRNDGTAALTTSGLALPSGFTLVEGLSSSIAAGGSDTFQVRLDTAGTGTGTKSGQISFATNDGDESPFNFSITGTVSSSPAPEIAVSGNASNIVDGDSTPDAGDHTDFGSATLSVISVISVAVTRTFTVRNDGTAVLTTSGLALPPGFTLVEGLSSSIAAGGSDTFQVRLDAAIVGTKSGQISFTTNDADENPFNFSITGTVNPPPAPEIAVLGNGAGIVDGDSTPAATDHTDFGSVTEGGFASTRTFTVRNDGGATLTTSGLSLPEGFSLVEQLASSIAPGAGDTFAVRLDAAVVGTKSGQISFITNDGDEALFNFAITGAVNPPPATLPYDFNGDGRSDLLWQHSNGAVTEWFMDGASFTQTGLIGGDGDPKWRIASGAGDFNGDGKADILWQHTGGAVSLWLMDGADFSSSGLIGGDGDPNWLIKATGDFNGDGRADIVWQHASGAVSLWLRDGDGFRFGDAIGSNAGWQIAASGDLDGDGRDDILWQRDDGAVHAWFMDGESFLPTGLLGGSGDPNWDLRATGDFNGDGKSDLIWQHATGAVVTWQMDGTSFTQSGLLGGSGDPNWQVKGTGDFSGDGKSDLVWQHAGGAVVTWQMDGTSFTQSGLLGGTGDPNWDVIALG